MRKGAVQSIKKYLCLIYAGFHSSEFAISIILVEVFIPGPINHWCQNKIQHKKLKVSRGTSLIGLFFFYSH